MKEVYKLTAKGCLAAVLINHGFDIRRRDPDELQDMVDEFFDAMIAAGHIQKVEPEDA